MTAKNIRSVLRDARATGKTIDYTYIASLVDAIF